MNKQNIRIARAGSRAALAVALGCGAVGLAHAEGSAQLGLNQKLLDAEGALAAGYAYDTASSSLFVDVLAAGEVINVSLCGTAATDDLAVEVYAPSDDTTPIETFTLDDANLDCASPMDAPLANPLRHVTTETGAYRLVLSNVSIAGNGGIFERHDISVTPDIATLPDPSVAAGRLWAYTYSFLNGTFAESAATDADLFALIPGGRPGTNYIWMLDLNRFSGNGYNLLANSVGVEAPDSGYSVDIEGRQVVYEHPLYLGIPEIADPRPVLPPELENIRFRDSAGTDYTFSPGGTTQVEDTGQFFFDSDVPGTYSILIDLNGDGVYGNAGDRQLLGDAFAGTNVVEWDGVDANGVLVEEGTYFAQVKVNMGEYHFVSNDAETSGGPSARGLTIRAVDKAGTVSDTQVYWDDVTRLPGAGGTSNTPEGASSGTPEGAHTWGSFSADPDNDPTALGNRRYIDTYVYGLTTTSYAPVAVVADEQNPPVNFDGRLIAPLDSLPGDPLELVVEDLDLNTDPGVAESAEVVIVNERSGERERVALLETGPDTSRFEATLASLAGVAPGADDDGVIVTDGADTLSIVYIDLIDSNGNSRVLEIVHHVARDSDGDGIDNARDDDDDDDGVPDTSESIDDTDTDGDGTPDRLDADSDGDGLPDGVEAGDPANPRDTDGDELPDMLDDDSDNDGIADAIEAVVPGTPLDPLNLADTDGDGVPDTIDRDSDGDGVPDAIEGGGSSIDDDPVDSDGDGVPDVRDVDSDNDGVPDGVEAGASGEDGDGDGIDDAFDVDASEGADANEDGVDDAAATGGGRDTDDDGTPDRLDLDSDGDGIADLVEAGGTDGDDDGRVDDFVDSDADGGDDRLATTPLPVPDSDDDGAADLVDRDADGDGVRDDVEGADDFDGDGLADYRDTDSDGDGLADALETDGGAPAPSDGASDRDSDGDGAPDRLDADSDGDGIPDGVEADLGDAAGEPDAVPSDSDADGTPDHLDADSDGDGVPDALESADPESDADGDGLPDFRDTDSDGDGILDGVEVGASGTDADGDGIDDAFDVDASGGSDADGDGIDDAATLPDGDGDGRADHLDTDSDGDGIGDATEASGVDGPATDSDGDGIVDRRDTDSDGDGVPDAVEAGFDGDRTPADGPLDSDDDGIPDYRETDSDGDGIVDAFEAGDDPTRPLDSDGDGVPDYRDDRRDDDADGDGVPDIGESIGDSDGDGVPDVLDIDSDNDGIPDGEESGPGGARLDSDADGIPDRLDLDSDGDGLPDTLEGGAPAALDGDGDGRLDGLVGDNGLIDALETAPDSGAIDRDGDGVADAAPDSDGDGRIDAVDLDADDDGIRDLVETGGTDADGDGRVDNAADANRDGRDDATATLAPRDPDTDADGTPDRLDTDSDGDGVADVVEAGTGGPGGAGSSGSDAVTLAPRDTDGDGVPDYLDLDSDGDGIGDRDEAENADEDGDGLPDALDSDGDGVPNGVEGTVDSDGDGLVDALDRDSDNDGIDDALEVGDDPLAPRDSDADGIPDLRDRDSDNDGTTDAAESRGADADRDGDGVVDGFVDADRDGRDDASAGAPPSAAALTEVVAPTTNAALDLDGDGIVDALLDADRDGIPDSVDSDFTGGSDSDGDGIDDAADASVTGEADSDGDGIADARDPDADGDGLADFLADPGTGGASPDTGDGTGTGTDTDTGGGETDNGGGGAGTGDVGAPGAAVPGGVVRGGIQGGGCSVGGNGAPTDPLLVLVAALAFGGAARRRRRQRAVRSSAASRASTSVPNDTFSPSARPGCLRHRLGGTGGLASALLVALALPSLLVATPEAHAQGLIASSDDFEREARGPRYPVRWYGGLGLGGATVEPDTSDVPGVEVETSGQGGVQLTLGADVREWLAFEGHVTDLGAAELSSGATLGYREFGASAIFYGGARRHRGERVGFAAFGRLGFGYLSLTGSEGLEYENANPIHVSSGVGVEYATRRGFAVRAEGIAFDADARLLQLGLLYRFGGARDERTPRVVAAAEPPVAAPSAKVVRREAPAPEPRVAAAVVDPDPDRDGVAGAADRCPATADGAAVDASGCAVFGGTLDGVTFESASARLTPAATAALDDVVATLARFPDATFRLSAHTDGAGDAAANLALSKERAIAVARHLVAGGIAASRFEIRAFGERRPIASNDTPAGRAANRRVELVVLDD